MKTRGKINQSHKSKIGILLVDDHAILREGLAQLIENESDMSVCGEAEDVPGALRAIAKCKPDLVMVDISLKGGNGIELIRRIRKEYPGMLSVALSMHAESLIAERALRAGARGYIMKRYGIKQVIKAIREVLKGKVYISAELRERILSSYASSRGAPESSSIETLSRREFEVFQQIGKGYRPREIALQLGVSVKTIETYRGRIKQKLGLTDSSALSQLALQWAVTESLI